MKKMYQTGYGTDIKEVEVIKTTEQSVWLESGRYAKHSNFCDFWDTIEDAKNHLTEECNLEIQRGQRLIDNAKRKLKEIEKY